MKQERAFNKVVVNKKAERSVRNGHPWVYAAEFSGGDTAGFENGEIIERGDHEDLLRQKGKYYQLYTGKAS